MSNKSLLRYLGMARRGSIMTGEQRMQRARILKPSLRLMIVNTTEQSLRHANDLITPGKSRLSFCRRKDQLIGQRLQQPPRIIPFERLLQLPTGNEPGAQRLNVEITHRR